MASFLCSQLGTAYVSATTGAVVTALGLKSLTKVRKGLTLLLLPQRGVAPRESSHCRLERNSLQLGGEFLLSDIHPHVCWVEMTLADIQYLCRLLGIRLEKLGCQTCTVYVQYITNMTSLAALSL